MTQSKMESLSAKNESLKNKVSSLSNEVKRDQDHLKALEKTVDTKKAFSKLKDKQINDALLMIQKASSDAVKKFKASDEYSDKLYDYYVKGFDLFRKYMAKHHPSLDFSKLDMEIVEKEILADRQSEEVINEGGGVNATDETAMDPSPSNSV